MALRFEVLGAAGAAPLSGACPAYVVGGGGVTVLLDCGPGALERLWRRGLLGGLDAVVISHMHADHVLDLVPLSGELVRSLLGRRIALHVPAGDGPAVLGRLDAAFARVPGAPTRFDKSFDVRPYGAEETLTIGQLSFSFAPTAHAQPCFAMRISDGRRVIVYGADGAPSDAVARLARGADLLVLEATFAQDAAAAQASGHMTAAQAGELAARAGARRLLLTHLLPSESLHEIRGRAEAAFGDRVELAAEGYAFEG